MIGGVVYLQNYKEETWLGGAIPSSSLAISMATVLLLNICFCILFYSRKSKYNYPKYLYLINKNKLTIISVISFCKMNKSLFANYFLIIQMLLYIFKIMKHNLGKTDPDVNDCMFDTLNKRPIEYFLVKTNIIV